MIVQLLLFLYPFFLSDKLICTRNHTLLFVAFDLEEFQPTSNGSCSRTGNCSCLGGKCGSKFFVQNLTQHLNSTGAGFQGALILETILNYNNTPHSQIFPRAFQQYFTQAYTKILQNEFRGDFLALIGRSSDDGKLLSEISSAFKEDSKFYKYFPVSLPQRHSLNLFFPDVQRERLNANQDEEIEWGIESKQRAARSRRSSASPIPSSFGPFILRNFYNFYDRA